MTNKTKQAAAVRTRTSCRNLLLAAWIASSVSSAFAQSTWTGNYGSWSTAGNWTPAGVPLTDANVIITGNNSYAALDVNATIANLSVTDLGTVGGLISSQAVNRTLTVTGTTALNDFGIIQPTDGCVYSLGTLLNFSNATLLYGASIGPRTSDDPNPAPSVVQWRGANIVRNEGAIGLGYNGFIKDQDTGLDALRNFSVNAGLFGVDGGTFVTPGDFTNFGRVGLFVQSPVHNFSRFEVGGNFANFTPSTGVLNAGEIEVIADIGRSEFAFPGADIRTLAAGTRLYLRGNAAILDSVTGANGLRNLGSLGGDFTLGTALGFTPTSGAFEQVAGHIDITTNGFLTITGNLSQFQGAAISIHNGASLSVVGNTTVAGEFYADSAFAREGGGVATVTATSLDLGVDSRFKGSAVINAATTISGQFTIGEIPDAPSFGTTTTSPGRVDLNGAATLSTSSTLRVAIAGSEDNHSVLVQSGEGGMALELGTLEVVMADGFVPVQGDVFRIIEAQSVSGLFNTITGQRVNDTTWLVQQIGVDYVSLAVTLPGDATLEGDVNISDFAILASHFNQEGFDWTGGNFNGDALVGINDFALMAANFNRSLPGEQSRTSVPEPMCGAVGAIAVLFARKRR